MGHSYADLFLDCVIRKRRVPTISVVYSPGPNCLRPDEAQLLWLSDNFDVSFEHLGVPVYIVFVLQFRI